MCPLSYKIRNLLDLPMQEPWLGVKVRIGVPAHVPANDRRSVIAFSDGDDNILFVMALARAE